MASQGYVRDEVHVAVTVLMVAINRVLAHAVRTAEARDFDEEPKALLDAVEPIKELVYALNEWSDLAEERESLERAANGEWVDFLAEHPELYSDGSDYAR